ncbi:MAG: hypothetical protein GQ570_05755 [Helicobacteraceae bacterium]|nr:hypothetical protein [Helicobacteraceae bacterium]
MPKTQIKEFENHHNIKIKENWNDGEDCVLNLIKLRAKIQLIMSNLKNDDFHKYPTVGIILQLTERIYEQITGSISCVCTKNHSSSEVLSRTAIESSVNILLMLKGDTESKTFSWLKKYISDDINHIQNWEDSLKNDEEKRIHLPRITTRRELHTLKKEFVNTYIEQVKEVLEIDETYTLPRKYLKRFQEVDEEITYHTVYSRLSATTHLNAEDTISYMMAKIYGDEQQLQIGLEHIAFSEFMLIYSLLFYTKIVDKFILKYSSKEDDEITKIEENYLSVMNKISETQNW